MVLLQELCSSGAECSHCNLGWDDDPRHTLFECEAWLQDRDAATRSLKKTKEKKLTTANMVPIMLKSQKGWERVSKYACSIMRQKMNAEWARQVQIGAPSSSTAAHAPPPPLVE